MEQVLAGHARAVFVCGIARNQDKMLDLFGLVFLLRIDEATQEARLAAHDALHPPGRGQAGREEIRQGRAMFETQMLRAGAVAWTVPRLPPRSPTSCSPWPIPGRYSVRAEVMEQVGERDHLPMAVREFSYRWPPIDNPAHSPINRRWLLRLLRRHG
jgi:hypothetical protein